MWSGCPAQLHIQTSARQPVLSFSSDHVAARGQYRAEQFSRPTSTFKPGCCGGVHLRPLDTGRETSSYSAFI